MESLPHSHPPPYPFWLFSFCVSMIKFMICAEFPQKDLWIIVVGQTLWSLFTTPTGYRFPMKREVELVASDNLITHANKMT